MRFLIIASVFFLIFGQGESGWSQIQPVETGHLDEYPGVPGTIGDINTQDVLTSSNLMFFANEYGTFIYDISTPQTPKELGLSGAYPGRQMALSGNLLFEAVGSFGWEILDVTTVTNPVLVSVTNLSGGVVSGIAASGNFAYVCDQYNGFCVYDVTTPRTPALLAQTNTSSYDEGVLISGHYAYVTTFVDGLHVFDVSDPRHPVQVARVDTGGQSLSGYYMVIRGNYLYLADGWDALRIFDISDPLNPTSVGSVKVGQYAQRVAVAGNYAYVAEYYTGLRICDISDPTQPRLLSGTNNNYGAYSQSVAISGNHVYLANGGDGLRIYSLSIPAAPHLSMNRTGGNVQLSWPAPTAAFVLQQSPAISGANWTPVTNLSMVVSNQNSIALPAPSSTIFYRLKFP